MSPSARRPEPEPDYYRLLGVSRGASRSEIMRAFRRRAFAAHPDHGGDADAFRDLYRARETLLDPDRRAGYDRRRRGAGSTTPPASSGRDPASETAGGAATGPAEDPFAWSSGAGPGTGAEPPGWRADAWAETPASYDVGFSWRRSDRFGWWRPTTPAGSGRRRRFSRSPS